MSTIGKKARRLEAGFTRREQKFLSRGDRKWERLILYLLLAVSSITAVAYVSTLIWTRHFANDDVIGVLFWAVVILFISDRLFLSRLVLKLNCRLTKAQTDRPEEKR